METPPPQDPSPQRPAAQPSPQRAAGYSTAPAAPTIRFDIIGQAFNMVFADMGTWVVAALLMMLVVGVVYGVVWFAVIGMLIGGSTFGTGGFLGMMMISVVLGLVVGSVVNIMLANMFRMALMALSGTKPAINEMFRFGPDAGNIILASLIVAVCVSIGNIFCYLPGLVVGALFMFTLPLVVDRKMAAMDAVKCSTDTLKKDIVMATIFYFVVAICAGLGAIAFGIGVIFTLPVFPIAVAMLYRDYMGIKGVGDPAPATT